MIYFPLAMLFLCIAVLDFKLYVLNDEIISLKKRVKALERSEND